MIPKHPYCRSCGSRTQSKTVCHHCGCEPMKGTNYCCDCGTSTNSQAIMCVECGASFQRKFPAVLAILVSSALFVTLASTGYFISQSNTDQSEKIDDNVETRNVAESTDANKDFIRKNNESPVIITNNISPTVLRKRKDAIIRLTRNIMPENFITKEVEPEPYVPEKNKVEEKIITPPVVKNVSPSGRISMNAFSSRELRAYSAACTYFSSRSENNVVFFTSNVYGYVKINGKVYVLQGIQKGNDIARFAGAGYEVTLEIEGLTGSEKEWFAAGTMEIKDVRQRLLSKHKINSSCTDF